MIPVLAQILRSPPRLTGYSNLAFRNTGSSAVSASSHTFSLSDLGAGNRNLCTIVSVYELRGIGIASSVSVDGISATKLIQAQPLNLSACSIWAAQTPSGGNVDIVVTHGTSVSACAIAWYTVQMVSITPHATVNDEAQNGPVVTLSGMDIPANGFGIIACNYDSGLDRTVSLDSSYTKDADLFVSRNSVFGHKESAAAVNDTVTITWNAGTEGTGICGVTFSGNGT